MAVQGSEGLDQRGGLEVGSGSHEKPVLVTSRASRGRWSFNRVSNRCWVSSLGVDGGNGRPCGGVDVCLFVNATGVVM